MKKIICSLVGLMMFAAVAAQGNGYIVINSEKIFKAVPKYTEALASLDKLAEQYQGLVDKSFAEVETMFNNYQAQKSMLSASSRSANEQAILEKEQEATKVQKDIFGPEGILIKKRVEQIKPIQDAIFKLITDYAVNNKYGLVIDIATNQSILYYAPSVDKTEEIIKLIK